MLNWAISIITEILIKERSSEAGPERTFAVLAVRGASRH